MERIPFIVPIDAFKKMLLGLKELLEGNLDFYGGNQVRVFFKTFLIFQKMLEENVGRPSIILSKDEKKLFQKIQDIKPAERAITPKRALREIRLLEEDIAKLKKLPQFKRPEKRTTHH